MCVGGTSTYPPVPHCKDNPIYSTDGEVCNDDDDDDDLVELERGLIYDLHEVNAFCIHFVKY